MKKDCYIKKHDDGLKITYFEKTRGEATKNHLKDVENVSLSGIIPFHTDEFGYNPGQLFGYYLATLNPQNENLFQRPLVPSKNFDIHKKSAKIWFANSNVGKNTISDLLPNLCKILELPLLTNHCIRATGIRALKRCNFEDRKVSLTSNIFYTLFCFCFAYFNLTISGCFTQWP